MLIFDKVKNPLIHRMNSWLLWRQASVSWTSIHGPWLFTLLERMRTPSIFSVEAERERKRLLRDLSPVAPLDFGAGSQSASRTTANIAKSVLKRPKHARALAALSRHIDAKHVLELGTCLGITTAYLSKEATTVTTLEGNPALAQRAEAIWKRLSIQNIRCITGAFDETLPTLPSKQYDLIFIDGNHRGDALIRYVNALAPSLSPKGVMVCDDIHWSPDMEHAWNKLMHEPRWTLKVDFYEWGMLTANLDLAREFHCIRF
jgi:predicted O-methyltransferase YrrM